MSRIYLTATRWDEVGPFQKGEATGAASEKRPLSSRITLGTRKWSGRSGGTGPDDKEWCLWIEEGKERERERKRRRPSAAGKAK